MKRNRLRAVRYGARNRGVRLNRLLRLLRLALPRATCGSSAVSGRRGSGGRSRRPVGCCGRLCGRRNQSDSCQRPDEHPGLPCGRRRRNAGRQNVHDCPGVPNAATKAKFQTHGLSLREGRNGVHTLYVVLHGGRESVGIYARRASADADAHLDRLRRCSGSDRPEFRPLA